jgi:uncharacterized membrane protein YcfT
MEQPVATVRESWVDAAKGLAIICVVLYHSVLFMGDIGLAGVWVPISGLLDTFRMPLFFFTAGLFAPLALGMGFGELFRRRIARLLWLYLLWSVIWAVVFQFVPVAGSDSPTWLGLLLVPVWPNPSTWFIYALAIFFMGAWLMRSWPKWVQFVPALVLTLVFGARLVSSGSEPLDKIATYYIFFLAAVHFGATMRQLAQRVRVWHLVVLLVAYVPVAVAIVLTDVDKLPGVRLLASVLAILFGGSFAVILDRLQAFRWLRELGARTLPVYLVHFYPILIAAALIHPFASELESASVVIPPLMTAVAIFATLGFWRITRHIHGLYEFPWARSARVRDMAQS